ncbi:MAG: SDR family oxidoreductase [Actinomycetota bacterium]|nr:SDR family oxidoreductase [Actinomycetota bacterium]
MSVLLAGLDAADAAALVRRLLEQGDQVRAIVAPGADPAPYEGAHVAAGDPGDDDLVERAAQGARTIVLGDFGAAVRTAALEGAARAGVERAVLLGEAPDVPLGMSWVALVTPRSRWRRRGPGPEDLAEAIDAADDLAGEPRLVADLGTEEGWRALRLEPR